MKSTLLKKIANLFSGKEGHCSPCSIVNNLNQAVQSNPCRYIMNYSLYFISILLFAAGFLNLQTERLADLDFDTSYAMYGLMFDRHILSVNPPILHPAISLAYIPFRMLYSAGIHPLTSLQIQYGLYLGLSCILFGFLSYRLTGRRQFSCIMGSLFSFFPSIQVIVQTMDDNIYSYPFLFAGLILSFSSERQSALNIYLRFFGSVILFSLMVFISMTSFLWVFFLSLIFVLNIFKDRTPKDGIKLLFPIILTGILCTTGFFMLFSAVHSLPPEVFIRETLGFGQSFSSENSSLLQSFSKLDYIRISLWQGLFSVPRSETVVSALSHMLSFITAKSKTIYPVFYLVLYYLFIFRLFLVFRRNKSFMDQFHTANLLFFLLLNLLFLIWYKEDSSFHERWDFFYLSFPWTAFLSFRTGKKTDTALFFLLLSVPLYFGGKIFYHAKDNYSDFRSIKQCEEKYETYIFTQDEIIGPSNSMMHILKNCQSLKIIKTEEKKKNEAHLYPFFLISKAAFLQDKSLRENRKVFLSKGTLKIVEKDSKGNSQK